MKRQEIIKVIKNNLEVSVLIIGAGINGIGTFRDLVLQGVDVLLVDKGDFCSGASSASSHMVHGGIRYLENGEFRLVREAIRERNLLLENAPHYVKPLPTTFPIFKWFSGLFNAPMKFMGLLNRPAERGGIVIKLGMMMYDVYTRHQGTVPAHKFTSRKKSLEQFPLINPDIVSTATYYDGAMPTPERICIDLLLDAEEDAKIIRGRAMWVNYMRLIEASDNTVKLCDDFSGEIFSVRPRLVINATGPWIDFTNAAMGFKTHFIGGTKGSHIVLNHSELRSAINNNEFFFENYDGRIVLILPLMDKVLVGTSDLPIDNPETARCTEEEIDYFLTMINKVFPSIKVDRSHIVFRFSGVRPLPTSKASLTGQISRDHWIEVIESENHTDFPIYNLIGGKWTTFRAFSEQVTDKVLMYLNLVRRYSTEDLPIGGGKKYPHTQTERQDWLIRLQSSTGLSIDRLENILNRYGSRAEVIARYIIDGDDRPLTCLTDFSVREVSYIVLNERVIHLDDFILRRSLLAMLGMLTASNIEELALIIKDALGWSNDQCQREVRRTLDILSEQHGISYSEEFV